MPRFRPFLSHCTCCILAVLSIATNAYGQRLKDYNNIGWYNTFFTLHLDRKTDLLLEYQRRSDDIIIKWQQSLARCGLQYNFKNGLSATAGYAFIINYPYGDYPAGPYQVPEHRLYEQVLWGEQKGRVYISHRLRLEQRFTGKVDQKAPVYTRIDWVYTNRIRYQLRAQIPLNKKKMGNNTWYATPFDEIFIGFGKNVNQNIFDQNRIGLSIGYQYNKILRAEVGYLNQTLQQSSPVGGKQVYQYNNGLMVNLYISK